MYVNHDDAQYTVILHDKQMKGKKYVVLCTKQKQKICDDRSNIQKMSGLENVFNILSFFL